MRCLLGEIRNGAFAREWIAEMERGEPNLDQLRRRPPTSRSSTSAGSSGLMTREGVEA